MAGRRDPNDPRNSLFIEYVKYLNFFKPKAFIMENVPGILSMKTADDEKVIDIIMNKLTKNYNCKYFKLLSANYEVPQNRRRVIFIGFRKDLNIEPTEPEKVLDKDNFIPVKKVLLPKSQVSQEHFLKDSELDYAYNHIKKMRAKGYGFGAQFLKLDQPSYTITASYWPGGQDALVRYSERDVRKLTILELKRIQTFPDNYVLEGTLKDQAKQLGNAVPCKLGYHLGKYLKNKLNE